MFRRAEESKKDWLVHFDYALKKLAGVGTIPRESVIYTEIFKARPDVNAAVHCHASMCVALSLADNPVACVHVQSGRFGRGVPIYPRPIYILDESEGADLARTLGNANGMMIKGHGIVTVGEVHRRSLHQRGLHGAHGENHGHGAAASASRACRMISSRHWPAARRNCSRAARRMSPLRRVELLRRQNQAGQNLDPRRWRIELGESFGIAMSSKSHLSRIFLKGRSGHPPLLLQATASL